MLAFLEKTRLESKGCGLTLFGAGQGEPVLILHGGGGAANWLEMAGRLSARHRVLLPEHPGFGASDDPAWLDTVGDLAYFYLRLVDELGLARVHLVGHSLGGWIAAEMAVRTTVPLASLTLVSAAGIHVPGAAKADNFLWTREETVRALYADTRLAERVLAHDPSAAEIEAALKNQRTVAKLVWNPRWHNPELPKWLSGIRVPTQIVWGAADRLFAPAHAEAFRDLIPGARVTVFDGCGHLPHVECADAFERQLSAFIQEQRQ